MQLKSGLTLPNGQKHQKMCVCKSNHSIYGKTMIFQVLSICISRMRRTNTCIHKLYVENWSETAINTCNTKMYNFVILIFGGGGGVNRYQVLIRCREKKSSNFIEEYTQASVAVILTTKKSFLVWMGVFTCHTCTIP